MVIRWMVRTVLFALLLAVTGGAAAEESLAHARLRREPEHRARTETINIAIERWSTPEESLRSVAWSVR